MARADKAAAVAEITEEFRASSAAVLTEYRGLTVGQLKELRRSLGSDTTYAVVKNTLSKIAAKDAGVEGFDDLLVGPTAIAFIKGDPVTAAQGLDTFAKQNPLLVIKGGVLDGKVLTAADVKKLAKLESREVLLAKVAGAANAAMAKAAALFQAPLSQAARTVDALRAQVEAEGPAVATAPADSSEPVASADVATENVETVAAPAETETVAEAPAEAATDVTEAPAEEAVAEVASEESAEAPAEAESTEG